jgi:hypothetical protein
MSSIDIEAIKKKITDAGFEIPPIEDNFMWSLLLSEKVLSPQEIGKIRKAILLSATTVQQPGK